MTGPLTGIRIVELGGIGPVPHCGMLLADLGADVIRVDRADLASGGRGDRAVHDPLNRGKRSVAADLKCDEGSALMLRLIGGVQAVIEGFRPGVAERMGLGPDRCLEANPAIVYGRMTGWGQSGPLHDTAGHDIDYLAVSGALGAIGTADRPIPPLNLVADFGGGAMYLAVGVLAGVLSASRTGEGTVIDAAMVDGVAHLTTMAHGAMAEGWWTPNRASNLLDGAAPFYTTYRTADGHHMAVGALEPKFYAELLVRLELDPASLPAQMDRERWGELREVFSRRFGERTRADWIEVFSDGDACVAPVMSLAEAPDHPHLRDRGTFVEVGGVRQPAPAPRFDGRRAEPGRPPFIGEHTDEVLAEYGWSSGEIELLRRRGIVG